MKKNLFAMCAIVAMSMMLSSCFLFKSKKGGDDSIAALEELAKDVSKSGDDWNDAEWKDAADKLKDALLNLPSPLETAEEIKVKSAIAGMEVIAGMHERKAADFIKVLNSYQEKSEGPVANEAEKKSYDLFGRVDKYPITMHLDIDGKQVSGSYFYNRQGAHNKLNISGTKQGSTYDLNETTVDGTPTGHFEGTMSGGVLQGTFTNNQGKKMGFVAAENGIDISSYNTHIEEESVEFDSDDSSSSSSSADVEAMLDSYDRYVTKYIAVMKKVAQNDASALAEYPSLMEQCNDLTEKLQRCKDDMSPAQWNRFNKITMRMAEAANNMR